MNIADLMDLSQLDTLVREGYIAARFHRSLPLTLYNYTQKATFERVWNNETRQCRGIIVDGNGTIVCWPFAKFANLGETGFPDSGLDVLLARSGPIEITEQLDGSMVALWQYQGEWHASTRGSFTDHRAGEVLTWLGKYARGSRYWPTDITYIGEWIGPNNRVVLPYAELSWRLIGARNNLTGIDFTYEDLGRLSGRLGVTTTPLVNMSLFSAMARQKTEKGAEGWVVRWPGGFRVKVKTEDYMRMHRIVASLGPKYVRERILEGTIHGYIEELPEELREEGQRIWETIIDHVEAHFLRINAVYTRCYPTYQQDGRPAFARAVQSSGLSPQDQGHVFGLLDGKHVVLRMIQKLDLSQLFVEEVTDIDDH